MKRIRGFSYQYCVFSALACVLAGVLLRISGMNAGIAIGIFIIAAIRFLLIWKAPDKVFYYSYVTGTIFYALGIATIWVRLDASGASLSLLGYTSEAAFIAIRCFFIYKEWKRNSTENKKAIISDNSIPKEKEETPQKIISVFKTKCKDIKVSRNAFIGFLLGGLTVYLFMHHSKQKISIPASSEGEPDSNSVEPTPIPDTKIVYWTNKGSYYHFDRNCSRIRNKPAFSGELKDCPKTEPCGYCCH